MAGGGAATEVVCTAAPEKNAEIWFCRSTISLSSRELPATSQGVRTWAFHPERPPSRKL
jgi:hypothetical protein